MRSLEEAIDEVQEVESSAYAEVKGAQVTARAILIAAYCLAEAIEEASKLIVNEIYDGRQ